MSAIPPHYNYATQFGNFSSVPAAAVFAALYVPLFIVYTCKSFQKPGYVPIISAIFSLIRIITWILRALLLTGTNGENLVLFIVYVVFFGTGFSCLLFISFSYLNSAIATYPDHFSKVVITRAGKIYHLVRAIIFVIIALGIWASTLTGRTSLDDTHKARVLSVTTTWLLWAVSVVCLLGSLVVAWSVRNVKHNGMAKTHLALILSSIFIVVRCSFNVAGLYIVPNPTRNEALFYVLNALMEFLALAVLAFIIFLARPKREEEHPMVSEDQAVGVQVFK
ncbi:hypothetical protein HK097_007960 [Rhizophlyctis rosea]|uniref:DUF7702 domain-containing protein n=1 Tax=Rhizophlyctis rosea TaxID=64517 RepID=A0AAD5SAW4_9FUNG|nr:hypothetical protein HK097_007960 [Rhizophlyctis rosea]